MVQKAKKLPKAFDYYVEEDQFAGGTVFCAGCPAELVLRTVPKVLGKNIVMLGTPGCSAPTMHGQGLGAWHKLSYYANVMTGVASSASGISRYFRKTGNDATVCCFTGDGDAADIGFQTLSGAAERNEHIMYICYDNEGYMNTGNQRSSRTPLYAVTSTTPVGKNQKGKPTVSKFLPLIMALHPASYVATATVSNMEDYAKKLLKAREKSRSGFAFIHVFAPCVIGFKIETKNVIELCRTAVNTNYFPLWEMEDGKFRITAPVAKQRPIKDYLSMCGKFSHLDNEEIADIQKIVDDRYNMIKSMVELTSK